MRRTPKLLALAVAATSQASSLLGCGAANARAPAAPMSGVAARYKMRFGADARVRVEVTFEPGIGAGFHIDDPTDFAINDVSAKGPSSAPERSERSVTLHGCEFGCTVSYSFDVPRAAERYGTGDMVEKRGDAFIGTPSVWMLKPNEVSDATEFTVEVETDPALMFGWGLDHTKDADGKVTYRGLFGDVDDSPYAAIGRLTPFTLGTEAQGYDVLVAGPEPGVGYEGLIAWAKAALANVQGMIPSYPRRRPLLIIMVVPGDDLGEGTTLGGSGSAIRIEVGQQAPAWKLGHDWILTHEMTHVILPNLPHPHHWAEEGMSVYLEPIMRAKRGIIEVKEVWKEWLKSMHQGEPENADDRLDGTEAWGRTYWGGALFWMQCDVALRSGGDPTLGIDRAFRAVFDQGDIHDSWPIQRVIDVMDKGTGTNVVSKLYAEQAPAGVNVDLRAFFTKLGVALVEDEVVFDDNAPLAAVRKAMVTGP